MTDQEPVTAAQAQQWWEGVQDTLAAIAESAPNYLPRDADHPAVASKTAEDILTVLEQAVACTDTAAGGWRRHNRRTGNGQQAPTAQPAHFNTAGRSYGATS